MLILLSNDDGIDAPGLHALREIARDLAGPGGEVVVVAPETNQSGAGHSLSLNEPLRMREVGEGAYAVRGTPTDSVIMALRHVLKGRKPDLLLSGINRGANMAEDLTYSGTVAAAFEGTLLGVRSIALSLSFGAGPEPRWETPLAHGARVIRSLIAEPWASNVLMSINFPDRAPDAVEGVRATRQGRRDLALIDVEARRDTWGTPYYWLAYERRRSNPKDDTDLWAVYNGYISVTPISLEMTHGPSLEGLVKRLVAG
ncbi:MAG TPA: 5'/3'-nucleotidase SurE [Hyphomicrobiaceae bacterium]|nr:5'/3'-nucleotidase SurE [Hyphomicrobiaceae bacterium]